MRKSPQQICRSIEFTSHLKQFENDSKSHTANHFPLIFCRTQFPTQSSTSRRTISRRASSMKSPGGCFTPLIPMLIALLFLWHKGHLAWLCWFVTRVAVFSWISGDGVDH